MTNYNKLYFSIRRVVNIIKPRKHNFTKIEFPYRHIKQNEKNDLIKFSIIKQIY